ncbi:zf-HC2 domain-containing protein [Dactylosporangium sp. NPDC005572]|uniref:zf-HC2 domain-containing protein n=1 Tax=Dactylosporangium sp. NPDC005572 TaxID=3156889 RepID=UPI0033B608E7
MNDLDSGHAEALQSCALYLLGALDEDAEAAFEWHLAECAECQDECDRLGPIATAMSEFSDEQVEALYGVQPGAASLLVPVLEQRSAPARPNDAGKASPGRPATRPPSAPSAPAVSRRPGARRSVLRRAWSAVGVVAAVILVVVGLVMYLPSDTDRTPTHLVGVSVTAQGAAGSARLQVSVAGNDGRSTVVASVAGLEAGVQYRLHAVTIDEATHQVAAWQGRQEVQEITGEIPVAIDTLAFFTVTAPDGSVVVSARIAR